jgi:hypothetical protein
MRENLEEEYHVVPDHQKGTKLIQPILIFLTHMIFVFLFCTKRLWYYLTDILEGGPVEGDWTPTKNAPFLFADGTPTPPKLLRDIPEQNYLGSGVRITGLALMAVSLVCSVAFAVMVYVHREKALIKSNQPFFLYVLLMGTFVMAFSVLFLSFDESTLGVKAEEVQAAEEPGFLDVACTIFPWFLCVGYVLIYSALFMKLWRINRVLSGIRSKVEVKQVVWPAVTLLGITAIILAVWTGVDPFEWERFPVDENEPLGESYGQCSSSHSLVFVIILALVMLAATILAGFMAWKTKDVDSKFSESSWIFTTIVLQFQVLVVGIPVLVIVQQQSADATYLGRILLIWTMTMSTLVLMFGPKLLPIIFPVYARKLQASTHRSSLGRGSVHVSVNSHPISNSGYTQSKSNGSSLRDGSGHRRGRDPYDHSNSGHGDSSHRSSERLKSNASVIFGDENSKRFETTSKPLFSQHATTTFAEPSASEPSASEPTFHEPSASELTSNEPSASEPTFHETSESDTIEPSETDAERAREDESGK